MNTTQENKLASYRATKGVCEKYESIWTDVKGVAADFADFTSHLGSIEDLAKAQSEPTTGLTEDKQRLREEMADAAVVIAGAAAAYASKNNNRELLAKVDFSRSNLLGGRDQASRDRCQGIHTAAKSVVASLADYDVAAADLKDLQDKINAYDAILTKPREARASTKTVTAQLVKAFDVTDTILNERLDKVVVAFRRENPEFVSDYQNARAIVDASATRKPQPAPKPPQP